jgi:hypothetical protein
MFRQVQLSSAASHCPTAALDRRVRCRATGLPQPMAVLSRSDMRRLLSHLGIRSARPSLPRPPKIRASPGLVRQDRSAHRIPPLAAGRPDSREEGSGARTSRAPDATYYAASHPGGDLAARLMTAIELRGTPEVRAIDLPLACAATGRRPAPTTTLAGGPNGLGQRVQAQRRVAEERHEAQVDSSGRLNAGVAVVIGPVRALPGQVDVAQHRGRRVRVRG